MYWVVSLNTGGLLVVSSTSATVAASPAEDWGTMRQPPRSMPVMYLASTSGSLPSMSDSVAWLGFG